MTKKAREFRLLREFRERLDINLDGLVVATEAGSGPFLYSSLAAALAGAKKVIAVAPDSVYSSHQEICKEISDLAEAWGLASDRISVVASRADVPSGVDIFLNLGFLRPLDANLLSQSSSGAVVSYMSEAWEYRPGDLDLNVCRQLSIPVAGVNEDYQGFGVFSSCSQLALKLLFEAGVEVAGCKIGLLSNDPFGDVIEKALIANSAFVSRLSDASFLDIETACSLDALFVASYSGSNNVLSGLGFSIELLASLNPNLKIIQFSGCIDVVALSGFGFFVYPREQLLPYRMSRTLAYLGVRPVLALHSLGIKVGELLYYQKNKAIALGQWESLLQRMV